jgi:hypothetical protein
MTWSNHRFWLKLCIELHQAYQMSMNTFNASGFSEQERFVMELEFVLSLANPHYINCEHDFDSSVLYMTLSLIAGLAQNRWDAWLLSSPRSHS